MCLHATNHVLLSIMDIICYYTKTRLSKVKKFGNTCQGKGKLDILDTFGRSS
jgi:hypothetical protein